MGILVSLCFVLVVCCFLNLATLPIVTSAMLALVYYFKWDGSFLGVHFAIIYKYIFLFQLYFIFTYVSHSLWDITFFLIPMHMLEI